jgi:hypothetical protein
MPAVLNKSILLSVRDPCKMKADKWGGGGCYFFVNIFLQFLFDFVTDIEE